MYKYGIVVIGYKNADGVKRLLNALGKADYEDEKPLLIISIDYSGEDYVFNEANSFQWMNGEKVVKRYTNRLGLRNHVLACGDYMNEYGLDALAVFEDDMMPSRDFFYFTRQATEKYINNDDIAGISLYTYCENYNVNEKFVPMTNGKDNYFFQCAQSRGQVWFRKQWNDFRNWYQHNNNYLDDNGSIPWTVASWPDTSWLKYHIKYCVEKNKYFVYPYISFSTCFGEIGEHVKVNTNSLQVPISNGGNRNFEFSELNEDAIRYDVFFENENISKWCGVDQDKITIDLYGIRDICKTKYMVSKKYKPYKVLKSWGNRLVPQEMNILYDIEGDDIYLYDMEERAEENGEKLCDKKVILYGSGAEGRRWLQKIGFDNIFGFADSDEKKSGCMVNGKRVFSLEELCKIRDEIEIFISANPKNKADIFQTLQQEGLEKVVIGSPFYDRDINVDILAVWDSSSVLEGYNCVCNHSEICGAHIGYGTYVGENSVINNSCVGRYSHIGSNVSISGAQYPLTNSVSVSKILGSECGKENDGCKNADKNSIEIGNDVWIGDNVELMEGIVIADGTIVANGAHVMSDTEPYSIILGNPARIIKYRFSKENIDFLMDFQWWNNSKEWIRSHKELLNDIERLKSFKRR